MKGKKENRNQRREQETSLSPRAVILFLVTGFALGIVGTFLGLWIHGTPVSLSVRSSAFRKFFAIYDDLHNQYVTPVSENTLIDGAVSGMAKSLGDPYTDYFSPSNNRQFEMQLANSFGGVGLSISTAKKNFSILSVYPNSPAKNAGIQVGDQIIAVNGKSVKGLSVADVTALIQGEIGTDVSLTLKKSGLPAKFIYVSMKRSIIQAVTVSSRMLDHHIGYIAVSVMGETAGEAFNHAFVGLKMAGMTRLILDLRNNPGGYVDQAKMIANTLLPKGDKLLTYVHRNGSRQSQFSMGPGSQLPIVILVNGGTASAAEILAAALNEDAHDALVGTQTFGKGTAQVTQKFADGSALKYTVDKWLTPNGRWIHKKGLLPTYTVQFEKHGVDRQLATAVQVIQ